MITPSRSASNDRLVRRLKRHPLVVVSPHFDDACLSLGGLLCAIGEGTLVNIFTRSVYLPYGTQKQKPTEEVVRAVRDAEDAAFAARAGLVRYDLRCCEPALKGRVALDRSHLEDDVAQAEKPLLGLLDSLAPSGRGYLLAPMGIGKHANHRATVEIVLRNLEHLQSRYIVLFYEDQPYAGNLGRRLGGLFRLMSRLPSWRWQRHAFVTDWEEKRALVRLYPSQFPDSIRKKNFRPPSLGPFVPHEAVWSLGEMV